MFGFVRDFFHIFVNNDKIKKQQKQLCLKILFCLLLGFHFQQPLTARKIPNKTVEKAARSASSLLSLQRSPFFDSLGIQLGVAYGHNEVKNLKSWRGLIFGGGIVSDLHIFRETWLKMGLGLNLQAEFYFLPENEKPFYLAEEGYLRLLSLRFENRLSFFPVDFLYFGPGVALSVNLTGSLGDAERGEIKTYESFLIPYITFHVGYKHRKPILQSIRWAVGLDGRITVNNEAHFELGARISFTYQFSKK